MEEGRVGQIDLEKKRLDIERDLLHTREYSTAMEVLGSASHALEEILKFGPTIEKASEKAARLDEDAKPNPNELFDDPIRGTRNQRLLYRLIDFYNNAEKITAFNDSNRVRSGYVRGSLPLGYLDSNPHYQPPDEDLPGPVQHYSNARDTLIGKLEAYNHKNRERNENFPHLDKRYKREPYNYDEPDPEFKNTSSDIDERYNWLLCLL
jgi:hypothetical protein